MSRFTRPIRSLLGLRTVHHIPNTRPVVIQRVKFSRGGNIKRTFTLVVVSYFLFSVYHTVVFSPLFKALDGLAEEEHPEDDDEEYEPLFIPLPFTTVQVDPLPYSGKDPEWQEFIKTSKDKELQKKLRDSLAGIVLSVSSNSALLTARFGRDLKVRRWWMDIDYPYRPPPEFERVGILFDEDIEVVRQKVDPTIVTLTQRILTPTPLLWSSVAFTKALMKQNAADVARMFGWEVNESSGMLGGQHNPPGSNHQALPPQASSVQKTLQRIREESTRRPEEVKDPAEMVARKTETEEPRSEKTTAPAMNGPASQPGKPGGPVTSSSTTATTDPQSTHDFIRAMTGNGPWDAFKGTWAKTFKPMRTQPPRGSFLVSGLVELETSRAAIVIDVAAWYHPQTKKYDAKSMYMGIRRVQLKSQSPLR